MTTPASARSLPYATLLAFTRYVDQTGPTKAAYVGGLRKQRESGGGFNPHSQLVKALKADIQFRTGGLHLASIAQAVAPRWRRLYIALTTGSAQYLETLGQPGEFSLTPTHDALGLLGNLPVRISAHFGLRYADGRKEAVRLHFDEQPPTPDLITATLHLMRRHMDQILPHAEPVLVDVRRGVPHRLGEVRGGAEEIDRWLNGEAAGFTAMWGLAPATTGRPQTSVPERKAA
ncbi:hypothetical protein [Hamadaea tsunoensis]|uniref:hypothetical protein n=1 Tax=Hamadaea tsunoensis TaxID=53368 RepID=UPI000683D82B|nr:hypothetical protein [Hamadaea tsunoensis]